MSSRGYDEAGVRGQGDALSAVERHLGPTLGLPAGAEVLTRFGQYASVMKLSNELAIAFSTDGVGSKTIIASLLDRYDTIGFDCVAMNVNDVICVGAKPIAMVDYLGVNTLDSRRTDEILRGLGSAAKEAGIAIPGGELAQLPEVIGSDGRSDGDPTAFDLVGTCIGTLHPDKVIVGDTIEPGDALIGISSSGIHSNGVTLARKVLLKDAGLLLFDEISPGRTLGDELLAPTEIYVRAVLDLWSDGIETKGLVHVTSDGFANLCRLDAEVGYRIEELPEAPLIFRMIRERGSVPEAEMFRVFNMGIGFVVVVSESVAGDTIERIERSGYKAAQIGTVTDRTGVVEILPAGLEGSLNSGESSFRAV
ncbi:MAG: phosphoribosylformylglycinamidine cyclo-ligase [Actinomycetota bacterium]|jgi:phosphoribosylformylglycinamidine cyclo-ligase|nr:phosphoribosylformylglycinamidine cyclo-ligase [Actinomycetota bacterium]